MYKKLAYRIQMYFTLSLYDLQWKNNMNSLIHRTAWIASYSNRGEIIHH